MEKPPFKLDQVVIYCDFHGFHVGRISRMQPMGDNILYDVATMDKSGEYKSVLTTDESDWLFHSIGDALDALQAPFTTPFSRPASLSDADPQVLDWVREARRIAKSEFQATDTSTILGIMKVLGQSALLSAATRPSMSVEWDQPVASVTGESTDELGQLSLTDLTNYLYVWEQIKARWKGTAEPTLADIFRLVSQWNKNVS